MSFASPAFELAPAPFWIHGPWPRGRIEYIEHLKRYHPEETVTVVIPEFVTTRWWESLLHNRTARRLEAALLSVPGVIIASVPYRLPTRPGS